MTQALSEPTANLQRFVDAQAPVYAQALAELRAGRKRTHWMWFVFPQCAGLGASATAQRYAIASLAEARAYLAHPLLGARLLECARAVLRHAGSSAHRIFGSPDDLKFRSSMTLFELASNGKATEFARALDAFYAGARDPRTIALLASR
ncbi:MAG TPA: DUF1810 domain-containing protein [Burkholderiaceae bacterium]